ncbi:50S ribosomal protein L20 [Patescibacteria group bacterium]
MRVKRGKVKRRKHKKILKLAKGYRLSYSKNYRRAKEAVLHAGQYSYNDRKKRPNDFRRLWIQRISGALDSYDINYSRFINGLKKAKIEVNRKMLSELAINEPDVFKAIVETIKK